MSEIDKLGRCSTDITLDVSKDERLHNYSNMMQDGFEVINYALYSVTRKAAPADHIVSDADHSIAEEAESLLRQDNHLVILDESRRRIWVFSHGHADSEDCLSTNKLVLSLAASDLTIHRTSIR